MKLSIVDWGIIRRNRCIKPAGRYRPAARATATMMRANVAPMRALVVVMFVACPSTTMIGRVAFCVGLYVELVVGYAVNMNCGVDVADIAVLILFTC